jgi:hypothetical protein
LARRDFARGPLARCTLVRRIRAHGLAERERSGTGLVSGNVGRVDCGEAVIFARAVRDHLKLIFKKATNDAAAN